MDSFDGSSPLTTPESSPPRPTRHDFQPSARASDDTTEATPLIASSSRAEVPLSSAPKDSVPAHQDDVIYRTPTQPRGVGGDYRKANHRATVLNNEMAGAYYEVKVKDIFDHLRLPPHFTRLSDQDIIDVGGFQGVELEQQEERVYEPMCDAFNRMFELKKLPYVMKNTSSHPQEGAEKEKPDLCLYEKTSEARDAYLYGLQGKKEDVGDDEEYSPKPSSSRVVVAQGNVARAAWAWIIAVMEVKVDLALAPFNFDDDPFYEKKTEEGKRTRAQIIGYATRIQRNQHRVYVPMIFIQKDHARLMLWDRSGVIVSKAFRYTVWPRPLLDFVYCIAKGGRTTQGYDGSTSLATTGDIEKLASYEPDESWPEDAQSYLRKARDDILGRKRKDRVFNPIRCVRCPNLSNPETTSRYLIGRYSTASRTPTGRGTKGYIAYDIEEDALVFLKDYWVTSESFGRLSELFVYEAFAKYHVQHVPTMIAGGRIAQQVTSSQTCYSKSDGDMYTPAERYHLRIVIREICKSLWAFKDGAHLVTATHHALLGHRDAYELANILHRDISPDNILIDVVTKEGLLGDWDMAKDRSRLRLPASQHTRSGTWYYLSGLAGWFPKKPFELSDDLEAFVWTFVTSCLRFLPHDDSEYVVVGGKKTVVDEEIAIAHEASQQAITANLKWMLEAPRSAEGVFYGCKIKVQRLIQRQPAGLGLTFEDEDSPLSVLLSELELLFRELYLSVDFASMERQYGLPDSRLTLLPKLGLPEPHIRSECVDNHARILSLFEKCSKQASKSPSDHPRTQDQFHDLLPDKDLFPLVESKDFHMPRAALNRDPEEVKSDLPHPAKRQKKNADTNGLCGQDEDLAFFGPSFAF